MRLLELLQSPETETLYVYRPLLNVHDVEAWAGTQGFASTLGEKIHVTLAFSKEPVDWDQFTPQDNKLTVRGGARTIKQLGDKGAVVLAFPARLLKQRWETFCDGGASWDFPSYQAHVTISYAGEDLDLDDIEPYTGDLIFGPESFNEVDEEWNEKIVEQPVPSPSPDRSAEAHRVAA